MHYRHSHTLKYIPMVRGLLKKKAESHKQNPEPETLKISLSGYS
jgi:hypothetical protein